MITTNTPVIISMDTSTINSEISIPNTHSTIVFGSDISAAILLQVAIYWIEQDCRVIYIRPTPHTKLPADVHGVSTIQESLQRLSHLLRFLYLPRWTDLLQFLFSIQEAASIPHVILVEGLDSYCIKDCEKSADESHVALIFASLKDSIAACSRKLKAPTHLIVSFDSQRHLDCKLHPLSEIYFSDSIWTAKELSDDKICLTKETKFFNQVETEEIFLSQNQNKVLFFEGIKKMFSS